MKKTLLLAALLPLTGMAAETGDTTFVVNNKKIVVNDSAGSTKISVYGSDGKKFNRTYETNFVDGQEIERVYVTSPFIPQSLNRKKSKPRSHYPLFFMGFSQLAGSVMGTGGNAGMHTRDSKSWEYGFTLTSLAFRITNPLALTSAFQIGQVHHHFQDNYVLSTTDGITSMRQIEGETLKKSYISYTFIRIPVMLEWQKRTGGADMFAAIGPSVELRWNDHSRYFIGKNKTTETGDINMNPVGLNLDIRAGARLSDDLRAHGSHAAAQDKRCTQMLSRVVRTGHTYITQTITLKHINDETAILIYGTHTFCHSIRRGGQRHYVQRERQENSCRRAGQENYCKGVRQKRL